MPHSTLISLFLLCLAISAQALAASPHAHPERWYQERWCSSRGAMEVVMPDQSRGDCMNATHAVEFDFGRKWGEAIGQALNYGAQSGRTPSIVLILEAPGDVRYLERVKNVRRAYGLSLDVWAVDREGREVE